ncbi:MAG: transcriptional repressor [Nitrospiraceae bacterium]|nr:MAG: transcriptional repressor [Nitrospiraceae bacterium]
MEKYRQLNIKLTPQRLAILDYLRDNTNHPSAEDIFKAVKKKFPTMSFATVYNTLETLLNKGGIHELKIETGKKRYDYDVTPHHHIICIKCRKIVDLYKDYKIPLPDEITREFELINKTVEFYGTCRNCKKRH